MTYLIVHVKSDTVVQATCFPKHSLDVRDALHIACVKMMLLTWLNCEFISCRSCSATTLAVAVAVAVAAATIAAALSAEGEGWYC